MKNLLTRNDVRRIAGTVYLVQGPNQSRYPHCNAFLIADRNETVLIDAGIGEKLRDIDRTKRIDTLVVSHSHPDHMSGWHHLRDRRILLPKETPESVTNLKRLGKRFTGNTADGDYWAGYAERTFGIRPLREPDGLFGDGDVLEFGETRVLAVHAPGHVDDHYCFLEPSSGVLLTTDIDLTSFGPWYGNPESDIETFIQSVTNIMTLPHAIVCSSHKPPTGNDADEQLATFLSIFQRQRKTVMDLCLTPRSLEEMIAISPFYRNKLPDRRIQTIFEGNIIWKNLDLLIRDGFVEKENGKYRLSARELPVSEPERGNDKSVRRGTMS